MDDTSYTMRSAAAVMVGPLDIGLITIAASEPSSASRPLAGMRILIAEDSWHLAAALRQTVEMAGAVVAGVAGTVAQAERLAQTVVFDAAVMDLNLHNERTNPLVMRLAAAGIKVVVISGYDVETELSSTVHACLAKPASGQALINALQRPLRFD